MEFSFATANRIHFGAGAARSLLDWIPAELERCLVVTGSNPNRYEGILEPLRGNGRQLLIVQANREPSVDTVSDMTAQARSFEPDIVIGIGGGSVLDSGKAVAALLSNPGDIADYLEVVGKGKPLTRPSLPYMAIPTTAGTGTEVTRNSVLDVPGEGVKVSLRSPYMLPQWAIVDPELTYDLPTEIAAYTGMDAFIQCLEAFLSRQANPLTDGVALEGISRAARSIRKACASELDTEAKADMCVASLCGGIALANAKLGVVHGFAGPIGGMINAAHGAICASLLLPSLRANLEIAQRRDPEGVFSKKFDRVAQAITGNSSANSRYAIAWIESLVRDLPLKTLSGLGFSETLIPEAVEKSARSSSMKGNSVDLDAADLREILESCLDID